MKESVYKTYDDLPLFLNADMVANVLGISAASSYELMHEKDFPVLKIGNRMVVPKELQLFTKVTRKQCAQCKSHQRPADL